jgi:hypothetical protein
MKEILDAGRAALGLPVASPPDDTPPAPAAPRILRVKNLPADFNPSAFGFEARVYRVRFKNGNTGEYDGAVLAGRFPFDPREIESVEAA